MPIEVVIPRVVNIIQQWYQHCIVSVVHYFGVLPGNIISDGETGKVFEQNENVWRTLEHLGLLRAEVCSLTIDNYHFDVSILKPTKIFVSFYEVCMAGGKEPRPRRSVRRRASTTSKRTARKTS